MRKTLFGRLHDDEKVYSYSFGKGRIRASVLNLGGIIHKLTVDGVDIICSYRSIDDIIQSSGYHGAIIGRYANRIAQGRFNLNGKEYTLFKNEAARGNCLHGGKEGFNRKIWNVTYIENDNCEKLVLTLFSPDGDEGFPGDLDITVTYTISGDDFSVSYKGISEADTPLNLTNHAYFNLDGYKSESVLDHKLTVFADKISAVDKNLIPTHEMDVTGTPFDFRREKAVGRDIFADHEQLVIAGGYDHNFIIGASKKFDFEGKALAKAAVLKGKALEMNVYTDKPCVQIFTTNKPNDRIKMKNGKAQSKHSAICFETQFSPDAPNHGEGIIKGYQKYDYTTLFKFKKI